MELKSQKKCLQDLDPILEEMEQFELDDDLTEAAEIIADIWT